MFADDEDDEDWSVCVDSEGRVDGSAGACETARPATWDRFVSIAGARLDELRAECQLSAWPLARGSFWLPADATPKGPLEQLASRVFRFHTAGASPAVDLSTSGVEWWTNVTRSSLLASAGAGDIGMHFDKDERAFADFGLVVHPVLSTITYLCDEGAPTVLLPHMCLSGAVAGGGKYVLTDGASPSAVFVPPRVGRHLCFDGRWLHGAPTACRPAAMNGEEEEEAYERVTFCANVWVNHQPGRCERFADRPALPSGASPPRAPRLRLVEARGAPAVREARAAEAKRETLRCAADAASPHTKLSLEQTDTVHELVLPRPPRLDEALRRGRVACVKGDGIVLREAPGATKT